MNELRELERRLLGEHPRAAKVHEQATRDAPDRVQALIDRFDAEATDDAADARLAAFNEELATLQRRALEA